MDDYSDDDGRIWPIRTEVREVGAELLDIAREDPGFAAAGVAYVGGGLATFGYLGFSAVTSVLGQVT